MKKILIGLIAMLYVGVASAENDFKILDTFPWPHPVRCTLGDNSLVGGWELANGDFIYVQEFENIEGEKILTVERYDTNLQRIGKGWGSYNGLSAAEVNMFDVVDNMLTSSYKMIFGFYSDRSLDGTSCRVKTPYALNATANEESTLKAKYYKMQRFEELALILH